MFLMMMETTLLTLKNNLPSTLSCEDGDFVETNKIVRQIATMHDETYVN